MQTAQRLDADEAITTLFAAHYASLVRTASLLVRSSGEAEEIVQDAFVAMHKRWNRLRDPDSAVGYLRRSVVNGARSRHRHHSVADKHLSREAGSTAPAPDPTMAADDRALVLAALDDLPTRQREVLVLRYYNDLPEADIAVALGISNGAVKSHASRGLKALRTNLEDPS